MTVREFLEGVKREPNKGVALSMMMAFLTLLDEFDSEACSVLASKIRSQMSEK